MEFTVDYVVVGVHQLERMGAVTIHVTMTVGNTSIRKQEHDLVRWLGSQRDEVPEHVGVLCKTIQLTRRLDWCALISERGYTVRRIARHTCSRIYANNYITTI